MLAYYTWSQGFRPGAFNRNFACYIPDAHDVPQYCSPLSFTSDNLTNNELGWKTEFFDRRLQWNGAIYQEDWNNVQVAFFDPGVLGNVGFGTNGPNYRIRGIETSIHRGAGSGADGAGRGFLEHQQADQLAVPDREQSRAAGESGEQGRIRTADPERSEPVRPDRRTERQFAAAAIQFTVAVSVDDQRIQCIRAGGRDPHRRIRSRSPAPIRRSPRARTSAPRCSGSRTPPISQYDASVGIAKDAWTTELYAQNLTNVNKSVFTSTNQFVPAEIIVRPRVLGFKLGYRF